MTATGRISMLVSRELQALVTVAKGLEREVAAENRKRTRSVAEPVFTEAVLANAQTRLQVRVIADSSRVAVADTNITLKAGAVGKTGGVSNKLLAGPVEFGAHPDRDVATTSRKGTPYTRRMGTAFRLPRRRGYVFFPAVVATVPRMFALWIQTTYRTVAEQFEKGAS